VALCWGLLAGLVVCVPAGYIYRFYRESAPLRGNLDYTHLSAAGIDSDWYLLRKLEQRNAFLGELSPAKRISTAVRSNLMRAADDVIERYRNSSDPAIANFDWQKAAICLRHVLEMDHGDRSAQGKLALCEGYKQLLGAHAEAAQTQFQQSVSLIPRAPDPHLALMRLYVYSLKNVGNAIAEMHEAERLGFKAGPREMEQKADGYRFRAASELKQAMQYRDKSRSMEERYLRMAQRDYDRARTLYEPIIGFSNVSVALREVDDDDRTRENLNDSLKKPLKPAKKTRKLASRRNSRWQ
jgi:hypothetical protein